MADRYLSAASEEADVLVVEQDEQQSDLLCMLLAQAGYRISSCDTGKEALEVAPELLPGLILLAVSLPDMDGFTVCQQLKQIEQVSRIPVIFMADSQNHELEEKGFEFGGIDFIYRPTNDKVLLARIRTQLELKSHQDALEKLVRVRTDTLNQALQELSHSNRSKDRFLDTISHELRTPLNGISGGVQLLNQTRLAPSQAQYLQVIQKSSTHLSSLLESILDFSEASANSLVLQTTPINLVNLLHEVSLLASQRCREKGLYYESYIAPDVSQKLLGDGQKLRRLLFHVLDNAVKFTSKGKVHLQADEYFDGVKHWLQVQVVDTGVGISEGKKNALFAPFHQLDSAFNRQHGGLGIGLPICHAFCELMGGQINIDAQQGVGTVVEISLPFKPYPTISETNEASAAPKKKGKRKCKTVLVVEDNRVNQMVQKGILTKLGYETVFAENGQEALDQVQKEDFLAILMDCQMPIMDGFEATRKIRTLDTTASKLPIIAITANAMSGDRQRCLDSGMDDYLAKPVKMDELKDKLQRWIATY